jgi:hypothetical protein
MTTQDKLPAYLAAGQELAYLWQLEGQRIYDNSDKVNVFMTFFTSRQTRDLCHLRDK